jgi:hypothetical protein
MGQWNSVTSISGALAAAVLAVACSDAMRPVREAQGPSFEEQPPPGDEGECQTVRFTGGGRIDAAAYGKITFGFNVRAVECPNGGPFVVQDGSVEGQVQIVHHPSQSKIHSVSITAFASYVDPGRGGDCADFGGEARVKHANGAWHNHEFCVTACDNGEPGRQDRFGVTVAEDGLEVEPTDLTGGNVQAHKPGSASGEPFCRNGVPL